MKPTTVIACDPSLHKTGIAVFSNGRLSFTTLVEVSTKLKKEKALYAMANEVHLALASYATDFVFVIEEQVNRGVNERMSQESFKYFSSLIYVLAYPFSDNCVFVLPQRWKKQIPKHIHHKRIFEKEGDLNSPFGLYSHCQPDIMDAIGIGRWYLGEVK